MTSPLSQGPSVAGLLHLPPNPTLYHHEPLKAPLNAAARTCPRTFACAVTSAGSALPWPSVGNSRPSLRGLFLLCLAGAAPPLHSAPRPSPSTALGFSSVPLDVNPTGRDSCLIHHCLVSLQHTAGPLRAPADGMKTQLSLWEEKSQVQPRGGGGESPHKTKQQKNRLGLWAHVGFLFICLFIYLFLRRSAPPS